MVYSRTTQIRVEIKWHLCRMEQHTGPRTSLLCDGLHQLINSFVIMCKSLNATEHLVPHLKTEKSEGGKEKGRKDERQGKM